MSARLFTVWIKNDIAPLGTYYRLSDDGFEKCNVRTKNGRIEVAGYSGIILPHDLLEPYVIGVMRNGVDVRALMNRQAGYGQTR